MLLSRGFPLVLWFIMIIITSWEFFPSVLANGLPLDFEWHQVFSSLQDSSQYSGDLNNAVVWMVSTRPLIFNSSSPFINLLAAVPSAPITIGIIVTFIFHCFLDSGARSRYFSFFSLSFNFSLCSAEIAKCTILLLLFFFFCRLL